VKWRIVLNRQGRAAKKTATRVRADALGGNMPESVRRVARAAMVGSLSVALLGMGSFGGREPEAPARDFHASFVDVDGAHIDVNRVTAGGDASLEGELGRGRLRVPFENIARIRFHPSDAQRDRVRAEVQLREGEPVTLSVRSSTTFYGRVPGGAYQIRARDLQSVEFTQ